MNSCIYRGKIKHARYQPVNNAFSYKLFMMYLDLAELEDVFRGKWLWSVDRFNFSYLRRGDHFGDRTISIDMEVRNLILKKTGKPSVGPIRMLTHLRYFGHCFNPATFYYCYDENGSNLEVIVVEIHNTPWGEMFCYVLDKRLEQREDNGRRYCFKKDFHVSPFIDMDIHYAWFFTEPSEILAVHMVDFKDELKLFEANLLMERVDISGKNLSSVLINYPFMTMNVVRAIYWQAFRLWKKGAPFYTHPKKMEDMGGVR
jgi:DUF1365 family protein